MADKPLIVEYEVRENDIYIGWNLDRDKIHCDLPLMIGDGAEGIRLLKDQHRLETKVDEVVTAILNTHLDIKIPRGYPYKLFEAGENEPVSEGTLRD